MEQTSEAVSQLGTRDPLLTLMGLVVSTHVQKRADAGELTADALVHAIAGGVDSPQDEVVLYCLGAALAAEMGRWESVTRFLMLAISAMAQVQGAE